MKSPLVSVVLPVFNGERYLFEAIQSILNQSYKNFELILINDGSTDKSPGIIKDFAGLDSRIVVISRENRGLVESLNEGIVAARGKYIARMDADDIACTKRFEKQVAFLENNANVGILGTWVEIFGENQVSKIWQPPPKDEECRAMLLFSNPVAHPSVMMRKQLFDNFKIRYRKEFKNIEDYDLWVQAMDVTAFANLPEPLLRYRQLETGITVNAEKNTDERFLLSRKIFSKVLDKLGGSYSEEEKRLIFIAACNSRIANSEISISSFFSLCKKLDRFNRKSKVFSNQQFRKYIAKRSLAVVRYSGFKCNLMEYCNLFFFKAICWYYLSFLNK